MATSTMIKKLSLATAGAALMAMGVAGTATAGTLIDTTPSWNGTDSIGGFGESATQTYGQTFTVGNDNVLNDFTFWLNDEFGPINFAGYVAEWDGSKVSGPILYSSAKQSTTNAAGFEQFTFNTGGLSLESGKQYVAFLSASNFMDGSFDYGVMGLTGLFQNTYSGGGFVFFNNDSDFSLLSQQNWDNVSWGIDFGDAAFKASFSQSVPEPGSVMSLLAFGVLGAGSMLKRKHQQKATVKA